MASSIHDSDIELRSFDSPKIPRGEVPCLDLSSTGPFHLPYPAHKSASAGPPDPSAAHGLQFTEAVTLDGNVLLCPCPDCNAPMTIRIWLATADCWRCGVSIALSLEQVRNAEHQLGRQSGFSNPRSQTPVPQSRVPTVPRPEPHTATGVQRTSDRRRAEVNKLVARRPARARPSAITRQAGAAPRHWWRNLWAWFVSAVVHLIALALLALLVIEARRKDPTIVLSTEISPFHREGTVLEVVETLHEVKFDLPIPPNIKRRTKRQRLALLRADEEARELRLDPEAADLQLPKLHTVKSTIASSDSRRAMLAARDPRVRVEMIRREGGTTLTEAAVARGLRWMSLHQNSDGSWSLHRFDHSPDCRGRCSGQGRVQSDSAATALVLLPFLGAGQTHLVGRYTNTVSLGLRWLIQRQKSDGDLRMSVSGNAGMYAQGQAAIVLCEAYAMTGDSYLREPAQKAIDFIVAAQHTAGGWRYRPRQAGDTSVLGWQLMALQSARAAQLIVPEHTLENAGHYLDSVQYDDGARYSYMQDQSPTHVMTAEALLCRMYLGWDLSHVALRSGVDYLVSHHLPHRSRSNFYYFYYATQAMHHVGGESWERWNHAMRNALVATQEKEGHVAGSWSPRENHDRAGGRLCTTAMATCTLEVYYRHVPIFRRIQLE